MTNREKLNEMSNDELFEELELCRICPGHGLEKPCKHPDWTCDECWAEWFNAEAQT